MSWPSDNKSDLTRLDNANDTLGRSRREIKRGIDNTNAILDEFDINTVGNKEVLRYNGTQWVPVDVSTFGSIQTATIRMTNSTPPLEILDDPYSILETDSTEINLKEGTYYFEQQGEMIGTGAPAISGRLATISIQVDGQSYNSPSGTACEHILMNGGAGSPIAFGTSSRIAVVDSASVGRISLTHTKNHITADQYLSWIIYKLA